MKLLEKNHLGAMNLKNRFIMAPMCMKMVTRHDGVATVESIDHYTANALGEIGLIIIEATAISDEGKISDDDLALYNEQQLQGIKNIVDSVHKNGAKIAIQLNHAGRKCGAISGVDTIYAPSAIAFDETYRMPKELTHEEIQKIIADFQNAAKLAIAAGVDGIEIHAAHGYLLNQFISPLTNHRTDKYANQSTMLLEVLQAIKAVIPEDKALWIRVSATDYADGGYGVEETIALIQEVKSYIDCVHVSSGGVVNVKPTTYPGYQVPFATAIKEQTGLPVIAVGLLEDDKLIDDILTNEKADYIAFGRPLLEDANWLKDYVKRHK